MTIVTVCVGSSCHLHGSEAIIDMLNAAIARNGLEDEVIPVAGFCFERCNRNGVTIQVDDDVFTGVEPAAFDAIFREHILPRTQTED